MQQRSPGNVGWLDWTPPGGGAAEIVCSIIQTADNPAIVLPSWQYVDGDGQHEQLPASKPQSGRTTGRS